MIFDWGMKPVIGVVHLQPLPGSPGYKGDLNDIIDKALRDARSLEEGGVNGIIVENYMDIPFKIRITEPETIAAMTVIVREIVKNTSIPVGVSFLRNSGVEALAIAYATGAKFIRVNVYCFPVISAEGTIEPIAREVQELKHKLKTNIEVYADVAVKHAYLHYNASIDELAIETVNRCKADAIIITGKATGQPPEPSDVALAKKCNKPVIIGSGITVNNIKLYWNLADGFIIGTYFKQKGITINPIDPERVKKLTTIINKLRKQKQ